MKTRDKEEVYLLKPLGFSMNLKYRINYIENPTEEDHGAIYNGINEYASSIGLKTQAGSYFFGMFDDNKKMVGAVSGFDNFGPVEIGGLWVHKSLRGMGYGTELIKRAEEWGRSKGCKHATVFTLKEWQVCSLYLKLGYQIEFERNDHGNGSIGCYLIKKL